MTVSNECSKWVEAQIKNEMQPKWYLLSTKIRPICLQDNEFTRRILVTKNMLKKQKKTTKFNLGFWWIAYSMNAIRLSRTEIQNEFERQKSFEKQRFPK